MSLRKEIEPIRVMWDDLILVDWGPTTMTISSWKNGEPTPVISVLAAWEGVNALAKVSEFHGYMRIKARDLPMGKPLPSVVRRALLACRAVSGRLSPIAAVAGAIADETADSASELGADRVIVNNGGDIAIRMEGSQEVKVGLRAPGSEEPFGTLAVKAGYGIRGVASSGWSGRSFSTGVSDMVTTWSRNAAIADAAATFIGSWVKCSGPGVERARAIDIDHSSDLRGTMVTIRPPRLNIRQKKEALTKGSRAAMELKARGLVFGAVINVQGDLFRTGREVSVPNVL